MRRACFDLRVYGPLVLAAAWFVWRERAPQPTMELSQVHAIELPAVHGLPANAKAQAYEPELDKCAVHVLVVGGEQDEESACEVTRGTLQLAAGGQSGTLELHCRLPTPPDLDGKPTISLWQRLGAPADSELVFSAELTRAAKQQVPGATQWSCVGTLQLGALTAPQTMAMWQCSLPGRPLQLQGHATVPGRLGLPEHRWLGLFPDRRTLTLGLDLAWRRQR